MHGNDAVRRVDASRDRCTRIYLLSGSLDSVFEALEAHLHGRKALVVTTPTVAALYEPARASREPLPVFVLPCSESTKTLEQVERICARAYAQDLDRESVLVALGGGVCSDLVTMAGSWIRRGIATIRIPTTLIGQIDAAIGVKGAVNFQGKKSALGCFYPAESVLIHTAFLRSLPHRHLRAGFAEIVKLGLACDRELFVMCERAGPALIESRFTQRAGAGNRLIWRAVSGMIDQLEPNLYEDRTYRRAVDFGHVFSPLLEVRSGYALTHGEAVAVDMAYSSVLSNRLGFLSRRDLDRILLCLRALALPCTSAVLTEDLIRTALVESSAHRGGKINLVLPVAIGTADFAEDSASLPAAELRAALRTLARLASPSVHAARQGQYQEHA